jgi:hypothetical protein
MRRAMVMGLAFLMSVAVSVTTQIGIAQQAAPAKGTAGAKDAGAATTASTAKDAGAATTASTAKDGGAGTTGAGVVGTSGSDGGAGSGTPMAPTTATASATGQMDGATYAVRLRDLEARVDELKDQIRRSHTRLALLSDTVMSGGAGGSRSEIIFKNEMSSAFKLIKAVVVLDGAIQYNRADETGALADQKEIPVFTGSVPPGDHTISTQLIFQGNGYGVFTYLKGYKFEVKSAHSFTAVEGKTMTVTGTALEKGGVTTPLEQRPQMEWHEKVQALGNSSAVASPGSPGGGKATGGVAPAASGGFSVGGGGSK